VAGVPADGALPCFALLGPLRARRGDEDLDLGPGKQRAVLAVLLLNANKPVGTPQIVDAVWRDEPPENGANVVQKYVAGLRRVLEPERSPRTPGQVLALTGAGYVLCVDADRLDTEVFARRVREAYASRTDGLLAQASDQLREALRLWRGEALAGLSGPLFDSARERLTESRAGALEAWAELELRLGRHTELVPALVELVAEFPLREELRYLLILALYRSGRQAEALAAFRDARYFLAEEFGVEPGDRLQELHRRILRSDPMLARPDNAQPASHPPPAAPPPPPPAWVPPPGPAPFAAPPRRWHSAWVAKVLAVGIPIVTCGFASWAVGAYYAVRRRSPLLGLIAVGLLGLEAVAALMLDADDVHATDRWTGPAILIMLVSMLAGSVQGALFGGAPAASQAPSESVSRASQEQRVRREQARQLLQQHPAEARELRIGRPDLPRRFDDGGLVDVNGVPVEVLAALPGVGWERARRIVAHRQAHGALSALDDLVTCDLLPHHVLLDLRDLLVILP
jgi:SARP family transcriptional regulator, regulator of embCAB operon